MVSRRIVLHVPHDLVEQPVVSNLVRNHKLDFNILRANVTPDEEGLLVLEITGEPDACDSGIAYLQKSGVGVQPLEQDVVRDDDRCVHCGACVPICTSGALSVDRATMKIDFDSARCIACELCVKACPVRAIDVSF